MISILIAAPRYVLKYILGFCIWWMSLGRHMRPEGKGVTLPSCGCSTVPYQPEFSLLKSHLVTLNNEVNIIYSGPKQGQWDCCARIYRDRDRALYTCSIYMLNIQSSDTLEYSLIFIQFSALRR